MNKKGFTLVEIIVSIAILGIIALATLPLLTFGYIHLFEAKKYTIDSFAVQQQVEKEMEILRNKEITGEDPSLTLSIFGKTIVGHVVQMAIAAPSGTAHGEINVFVPKYKVNFTVPVVTEGDVVVTAYRDGTEIPEGNTEEIFPLAAPEIVAAEGVDPSPASYVTLEGSEPEVSTEEFLMNVYRWYMSPVTTSPPSTRDLIIIKEWNAARTPLSFEDSEDLTYIPNVENNYNILDFREFFSHLGLSEEELCEMINERFSGRYFYYSVTPYSTIGRVGVEEFSQEIISTNKITAIEDIYETIPVGSVYYPNDHYSEVPALMHNGETLNVPVVWSPAAMNVSVDGEQVSQGTVVGYPEGVKLYLTVLKIDLESISIDETKIVTVDDKFQLGVIYTPSDATDKRVNWSSSNESIVSTTENPGWLTAKSIGTVTITATSVDGGFTDQCIVTVNPASLNSVVIAGLGSVGNELTTTLDPPEAAGTATYQWQRSSSVSGIYQIITGATASSYTLTNDDSGQYIRAIATGNGNYKDSVISNIISIGGNSGWRSPTSFNDDNGVNNETRAYTSDNNWVVFDNDNDRVDYKFVPSSGTIVPNGAIITGIEVSLEASKDSGDNRYFTVALIYNGNTRGTKNIGNVLTTTDTLYTLGSMNDDWYSGTWTFSEINSNAFEIRVSTPNGNNNHICYLDQIQIRVHYTMP